MIADLLPKYSFPHEAAIRLNVPVLLFSVALALVTGILFGLWPSLQLSRPDVVQVMQSSTRRIAGGTRGRTMNTFLIGGKIALTLVMLAGAGAAMRGLVRLLHTPLGYDPHNIMSVGIPVHDGAYPTWAARAAYFEQLRNRLAAVPGVTMTAISSNATPPCGLDVFGEIASGDREAPAVGCKRILNHRRFSDRLPLASIEPEPILLSRWTEKPHVDHTVRRRVRERVHQDRINHAENGGGCPDAQGERHYGGQCEAGVLRIWRRQ